MRYSANIIWVLCLALVFVASACTEGGANTQDREDNLRFVFVTHGQAADPFWSIVQNGMRQAARDAGVRVEYQAPDTYDMVVMGQLLDAAIASNPDGLVISMPDESALGRRVRDALDAGIPVISINSGYEAAQRLGVMTHVGQTEYEAGFGGGERMAAEGVRKALCVNMEVGNTALDLRCQGFSDAMEEAGASVEMLAVELGDPTESQQRMEARLSGDAEVDGILTLGPTIVEPAIRALRSTGRTEDVKLASFDLSPEILRGVDEGTLLFAIDQQPYLQGYLPVMMLSLYVRNGNTFPNEVTRTGPAIVTQEYAGTMLELARAGTR